VRTASHSVKQMLTSRCARRTLQMESRP